MPDNPTFQPGEKAFDFLGRLAPALRTKLNNLLAQAKAGAIIGGGDLQTLGNALTTSKQAPLYGVLSGSTSPYGFTEVVLDDDWEVPATPLTGTAHEVNQATSLGGQVVRLYGNPAEGYHFQHIRLGAPEICDRSLCITATGGTDHRLLAGALVTLKLSGTLIDTCTTTLAGECCIPIPVSSDQYTVTVSNPGYTTQVIALNWIDCSGTADYQQTITLPAVRELFFDIPGCTANNQGVTVAVVGTGSFTATGNWDAANNRTRAYLHPLTPGANYTFTISKSRYTSKTGSLTWNGTGWNVTGYTAGSGLVPTSSYFCCFGCSEPISRTLTLTTPLGTFSMVNATGTPTCTVGNGPERCFQITRSGVRPATGCSGTTSVTGSMDVRYNISTPGPGVSTSISLWERWQTADCSGARLFKNAAPSCGLGGLGVIEQQVAVQVNITSCNPFLASFTMPATCPGSTGGTVSLPNPGLHTLTE